MKNSPLFDTAFALMEQAEQTITLLENKQEKKPLTKREMEIYKIAVANKKVALRMFTLA
jgi:hypothetical protein